MEELRKNINKWYKENYKEGGKIKKKDSFCPIIKEMCLGNDCSFWISDANDPMHFGDHPCSINVIASYFMYKKEKLEE